MSRQQRNLPRSLSLAIALVAGAIALTAPVAAAAPFDRAPLAVATVYAGGVDFLPSVAYRGATITVAGPSGEYERTFEAGERLSVDLFDPDGQLLADGVYSWRLSLTPADREARELRRAARRNGGEAPDAWQALTGSFAVRNGLMADASLAETRRARPAVASNPAAQPTDLAAAATAARIADDDDRAVAAGGASEAQTAAILRAAPPPAAGAYEGSDAATAAARPAPVSRAVSEEPATPRRSWSTDGKNGRDQ